MEETLSFQIVRNYECYSFWCIKVLTHSLMVNNDSSTCKISINCVIYLQIASILRYRKYREGRALNNISRSRMSFIRLSFVSKVNFRLSSACHLPACRTSSLRHKPFLLTAAVFFQLQRPTVQSASIQADELHGVMTLVEKSADNLFVFVFLKNR